MTQRVAGKKIKGRGGEIKSDSIVYTSEGGGKKPSVFTARKARQMAYKLGDESFYLYPPERHFFPYLCRTGKGFTLRLGFT